MKIWPNLLFSILFHAALLGLLMLAPPFVPPGTQQYLIVDLVTLDGGGASGGDSGGGPGTSLPGRESDGHGEAAHNHGNPGGSATLEPYREHRENPNGETPPGQMRSPPTDPAVNAPKPMEKAKIRRADRGKNKPNHVDRRPERCTAEPGGIKVQDSAAGPGVTAPKETGQGERTDGNVGGGHGADAGFPGDGAGSSFSGVPVEARLGSANGPRFVTKVLPKYPHRAREMGMEGTVVLRVTIDTRGMPIRIESVRRAGYGFEEEAIRALENSTFAPARTGGRVVACRVLVPVRFQLTMTDDE
jgi:periplasmic protein TonB